MTIQEIIASHVMEKVTGVPDTWSCSSDNHYFDENIVLEDQCHVRQLIASLPQEILDNNRLREIEIVARELLEAIDEGWGGERWEKVVETMRNMVVG